jgi:phosphatidate phosphatase LPIN
MKLDRSMSDGVLPAGATSLGSEASSTENSPRAAGRADIHQGQRSTSPPLVSPSEAISRAMALSKKLSGSNIPSQVTDTGDLMLDMTGYKTSEDEALRAEVIARNILSEELEGNYDIGALIGADDHGNLWIYSSEEAKLAANHRTTLSVHQTPFSEDAVSDPGYHSDGEKSSLQPPIQTRHHRAQSDVQPGFPTPPQTPPQDAAFGDLNRNFAKTLRLTSDQLKALNLKPGANNVTFTVNKATCPATMYLWNNKTPIVISDIDGTITK